MKYYLKLGFVLLIIAAVASGILAFVNGFTKPIIEQNRAEQKEMARREVLPDAVTFESILKFNNEDVYCGKDDSGEIIGYTIIASLYGYSSDVKTMVGVTPDFLINKIKIIDQKETPGLGANCVGLEFQAQFSGKKTGVKVDKDGGEIASLTGATITSRTIANSISNGIKFLEKEVSKLEKKEEDAE